MATKAQIRAVAKYDAANTRNYHFKLNLKTDQDIIERLGQVPSMQGYIKDLIRDDIRSGQNCSQNAHED